MSVNISQMSATQFSSATNSGCAPCSPAAQQGQSAPMFSPDFASNGDGGKGGQGDLLKDLMNLVKDVMSLAGNAAGMSGGMGGMMG
jgi:hypothetical protein